MTIDYLTELLQEGPRYRFDRDRTMNGEQAEMMAETYYSQWFKKRVLPLLAQMTRAGDEAGITITIGDNSSDNQAGTDIHRGDNARQ